MNFFFSPLEQFEILPLISIYLSNLDFSITNETTTLILIFFLLQVLLYGSFKADTKSLYIIPHFWQSIIEFIYKMILSMIIDNIGVKKGQLFFPLIFSILFYCIFKYNWISTLCIHINKSFNCDIRIKSFFIYRY